MKVTLIGAGNMGLSWAGAALLSGHKVHVIDKDPAKLMAIKDRLIFNGEEAVWQCIDVDKISTSTDLATIKGTSLVFIAVQTPVTVKDGRSICDYKPLIGLLDALHPHLTNQIVLLGSTVFPGAISTLVAPRMPTSVQFAYQPVFLRAGAGVTDYLHPPKIVVGVKGEPPAELTALITSMTWNKEPIKYCSYGEAEFIKLMHNTWMCLKINFANEVGAMCNHYDVDAKKVIDLTFGEGRDGRLLTQSHMIPGPPFSGTCLPKDSAILNGILRDIGLDDTCRTLASAHDINKSRVHDVFNNAISNGERHIGVLGMSYRPGYNDARDSLAVQLFEMAKDSGFNFLFWDHTFSKMSAMDFKLAARGNPVVESMAPVVTSMLGKLLSLVRVLIINMPLDDVTKESIRQAKRSGQLVSVIDLYRNGI